VNVGKRKKEKGGGEAGWKRKGKEGKGRTSVTLFNVKPEQIFNELL